MPLAAAETMRKTELNKSFHARIMRRLMRRFLFPVFLEERITLRSDGSGRILLLSKGTTHLRQIWKTPKALPFICVWTTKMMEHFVLYFIPFSTLIVEES